MTRLIGGVGRGRPLRVPSGRDTRPTADRAREGLFNTLESMTGGLSGVRVLDLYAGSGAVGVEALSRGAAHALLVESAPRAVAAIRDNLAVLGSAGGLVRAEPVERVVATSPDAPYGVVFADPPYALAADLLAAVLATAADHGWFEPDAVIAVERSARDDAFDWPAGIEPVRVRRYGEAALWYGRAASAGHAGG